MEKVKMTFCHEVLMLLPEVGSLKKRWIYHMWNTIIHLKLHPKCAIQPSLQCSVVLPFLIALYQGESKQLKPKIGCISLCPSLLSNQPGRLNQIDRTTGCWWRKHLLRRNLQTPFLGQDNQPRLVRTLTEACFLKVNKKTDRSTFHSSSHYVV